MPSLERSVGLGPTFFPAQRCLGHCSVCRHPTPINPDQAVIGQQPLTPEGLEHTGLGPFAKTAVGGRWRTDAGGFERLPLTTRAQDKEDRVHRGAIWNPRIMAAQRMRWTLRQQRLHAPPELIRQPPAIVLDQSPHRDLHPLKSKSPTAQIRQAPYWNRLLAEETGGDCLPGSDVVGYTGTSRGMCCATVWRPVSSPGFFAMCRTVLTCKRTRTHRASSSFPFGLPLTSSAPDPLDGNTGRGSSFFQHGFRVLHAGLGCTPSPRM